MLGGVSVKASRTPLFAPCRACIAPAYKFPYDNTASYFAVWGLSYRLSADSSPVGNSNAAEHSLTLCDNAL